MLIGITGGIGAGKSVVSRILRLKGYQVYDCDSRAKHLMEESELILDALEGRFGRECLTDERKLNREVIAGRVFSCDSDREWLNALVHAEVRKDLNAWYEAQAANSVTGLHFVESAIMQSSGLSKLCDKIILVEAPQGLRVSRAMQRGGISEENLLKRIESQRHEFELLPHENVIHLENDESSSLLCELEEILNTISI